MNVLFVMILCAATADDPVSYARQVAPLLDEHCLACHDDGNETSGLALHDVPAMVKGGRHGAGIVVGRGDDSALVQYMKGVRQPQMPPKTSIPLDQIDILKRWIDQGAKVDAADPSARREEVRKAAAEEAATFASDAPPPVTGLSYSPDGRWLAVASYREVIVVEAASGKLARRLAGFADQVTAVAFDPAGSRLAAAGGSPGVGGEVRVWRVEGWQESCVLRGHADTALSLAWRPHTDQVATSSLDKLIMVWDVEKGSAIRTIKSHADIVNSVAYSPDGRLLASASADRTAKVFDADSGLQVAGLASHGDSVLHVAFSPDGKYLATSAADAGIALWKVGEWRNPERKFGHTGPVYNTAWRADSESLWSVSGGRPSFLSYKKVSGDRAAPIDKSSMPKDWLYAAATSPDGTAAAVGGWGGEVTVYGLQDGKIVRRTVPGRDK